ncbi:MAG: adenosylcobinamide-GDP ribazoletransferase [Eubacteriales bacterium]|nr:adenosylcobinamide-GDP ribazoletransferase [Eubacteriales bacterium]MDN5363963.1 adenosylcobinamide-GDP ribazoletransferase [Eubacteriales bacterium]
MERFLVALQNLTRIYVKNVEYDEKKFGSASLYFPLVGLIIGLAMAGVGQLTFYLTTSPAVTAGILLMFYLYLTGSIHLDGFMDTMDGLFCGRLTAEERLAVMKDSRAGAFGVLGVVALLLLRYALYTELIAKAENWWWLILTSVFSRWAMVLVIYAFPYARPEGMGKAHHLYTRLPQVAGATLMTAILAFFPLISGAKWYLLILPVVAAYALLAGRYASSLLGGVTGDVYGATAEGGENVTLFLALLGVCWLQ